MDQPPWAEHEKVYLLAEILKAAPISSHVLFNLIRDANAQVRWNDIALPPGRSLRSCQLAYSELGASLSAPDYRRPQLPVPMIYPGPDVSKKRPHQPEHAPPIGRLLQPRPPHSYPTDYMQAGGPVYNSAMAQIGEPSNKKKRGRPTKAEAQQRAQDAAARGEVYPPPRRGRGSISIAAAAEPSPPRADSRSDPRMHTHTPPQSVRGLSGPTMTPQQQQMHAEPESESSSGKRRRTRPEPLELEKSQHGQSEMQSPLTFGSGDPSRNHPYSSFTPISAPLPSSSDSRDRDSRMEGVEETQHQPRTTTPHSFKDTVGI